MPKEFPGPKARRILEENTDYYATTTQGSRIVVKSAKGSVVTCVDGFKFFDLHCDAGTNNLGHGHPLIDRAIQSQLSSGVIFSEHHNAPVEGAVEFARILAQRSPVKEPAKVFFCNSGAEANEAARKLCRGDRHHSAQKDRRKAIYFTNGFAGRTGGVLEATTSKPETQRDPFWDDTAIRNSIYLPYPTKRNRIKLEETLSAIDLKKVDRLLIELRCQGEGGIIPADEEALKFLYEKTQEAGVYWITDAVQCGMGRTGTLFGCDNFKWLKPDILTLGKALGGGLPIGATIFRSDINWRPGEHSNTFGGGPMVMAPGLAAFHEIDRVIDSGMVRRVEEQISSRLNEYRDLYSAISEVRGVGAMWAVEFTTDYLRDEFRRVAEGMAATHGHGLRLLGAGRKAVRLMPPINISEHELGEALDLFGEALNMLKNCGNVC